MSDDNVIPIRSKVIEKNLPELSEATNMLLEGAYNILRLSGMKIAMVEGINQQTGKANYIVTIQLLTEDEPK